MAQTMFGADVRYHTCDHCGAPMEVPVSGGTVTCEYCGTAMQVGVRNLDQIQLTDPSLQQYGDEATREQARLASLRAQEQSYDSEKNIYAYYDAPPGLEHLELESDDPSLPPLIQQAFAQALARCQASGGALQDQRHVYWVARKAKNMWAQNDQPLRARPTIETAAELLTDPGYRQIMRCILADLARRGGDIPAAESWLAGCDPRPPLLDLDSDYRTSAALVAVYKGDWQGALHLVGAARNDVPFEPSSKPLSVIIRAACLEAMGQGGRAESELAWVMDRLDDDFFAGWMNRNRDCPLAYSSMVWDRMRARQASTDASAMSFDVHTVSASSSSSSGGSMKWLVIGIASLGILVPIIITLSSSGDCSSSSGPNRYDPAVRATLAMPVTAGQMVQGNVDSYQGFSVYRLSVATTASVRISVTSSWDNYVEVFPSNGSATVIEDDDSGGSLNAMCQAVLAPGEYHIVVRPYSSGSGPFTMMVAGNVGAPQPMPVQPMPVQPMPVQPMPVQPVPGVPQGAQPTVQ